MVSSGGGQKKKCSQPAGVVGHGCEPVHTWSAGCDNRAFMCRAKCGGIAVHARCTTGIVHTRRGGSNCAVVWGSDVTRLTDALSTRTMLTACYKMCWNVSNVA